MNKNKIIFQLSAILLVLLLSITGTNPITNYLKDKLDKKPPQTIDYFELKLPIDTYCIDKHPRYNRDFYQYSKARIILLHSLDGVNFYYADSFEVHSEDVYIRNFTRPVNRKVNYTIPRYINCNSK